MNQKDKDLLLKDLCARLPWGVKVHKENSELDGTLIDTELRNDLIVLTTPEISVCTIAIENCKPYLRPRSEISNLISAKEFTQLYGIELIDWYNANHIDYRGLIEKNLAIKAPKDMYK